MNHPATGTATATAGKSSQPDAFVASSFNKTTSTPVAQTFQLQAEAAGNDTTSPAGTLNFLYGAGATAPSETGLKISSKGLLTFASGQTFPGGTIMGNETVQGNVVSSGELISTISTGTAPLKVSSTTQVANLNASLLGGLPASVFATHGSNAFVGTQSVIGSLGIGTTSPAQALDMGTNNNMVIRVDPGSDTTEANGGYSLVGRGVGGAPNTWWTYTAAVGGGFGVPANSYSIWQYPPNSVPGCCLNRFNILPAEAPTDTGGAVTIDQNGNASQPLAAGGFAKAMVSVNGFQPPYSIVNCFNSTLTGAAATTPPCGMNLTENAIGVFDLAPGFTVENRFFSATLYYPSSGCIGTDAVSPHTVRVVTADCSGNGPFSANFHLIIY